MAAGIDHNALLINDQYGAMGGGAAWFDHDNDGFQDLYLTGFEGEDRLYRNNGDGTFSDISVFSGIADITTGSKTTGIVSGDIDNDGDRDLFVSTGPDAHCFLLIHNADHTYSDISQSAGITELGSSYSAAMGDYDLDGFLDIYVTNWVKEWDTDPTNPQIIHEAWPDFLYHNNGDGTFTNVAAQFGLADTLGCGLAVAFTDVDMDDDQDLFVVNDFGQFGNSENRLLMNLHPSSGFVDDAPLLGLNAGIHGMGIAIGDINEDGQLDYYATNMGANVYHLSNGSGGYDEVALQQGVHDAVQGLDPSVGWGCTFLDIDNDSDLDLAISNGSLILGSSHPNNSRMFLNDGTGDFVEIGDFCGVSDPSVNRGLAQVDFDNDGDLDLFMVRMDTSMTNSSILYENSGTSGNNWLKVSLEGVYSNRDGYGAKVFLQLGNRTLIREIHGGSSYCSQNSSIAHFGLGASSTLDSLWVVWPGGYSQPIEPISLNQQIHVVEDQLVGISTETESSLSIRPTSFTESFLVNAPSEISQILVVDGSGRWVISKERINSRSMQIEMKTQPAGIYNVIVNMKNGQMITRKVIKG